MSISLRLVFLSANWHWLVLIVLDHALNDRRADMQFFPALLEERIGLRFSKPVQWDIELLSIDLDNWIAIDEAHPVSKSRISILSSKECQHLLHQYLDDGLYSNFRLLVKISSLLYGPSNSPHPHYNEQLHLMRSFS